MPPPEVPDGWALVEVRAVGVCGSDLHAYAGKQPFFRYPRIPGHEAAGVVVDGPPEWVGRRVALDPSVSCGKCRACLQGRENCCREMRVLGVHLDGAMAELVAVPSGNLHYIGDLPFEAACLAEPLSIALHAARRGCVTKADEALVLGCGPIGLFVVKACKLRGARAVVAADRIEERLEAAKKMGADEVINVERADLRERCEEIFGPDGPSIVFEATGSVGAFEEAVETAGPAGRVVLLGFSPERAQISPFPVVRKELDIVGSRLGRDSFGEAVEALRAGLVDPSLLPTSVYPLVEVQRAFEEALERRTIKAVLRV